jgi:hypothetical protein
MRESDGNGHSRNAGGGTGRPGRARSPEKEAHWRAVMERWRASGQTIRAFCEAHGIKPWSFHNWRRELRARDAERRRGESAEAVMTRALPAPADASRRRFVELAPIQSNGRVFSATTEPAPIEIVLDHGGTVVRLGREFDPGALRDVLAILRESAAC